MLHLKLAVVHLWDKTHIKALALGLLSALFAFLLARISVLGILTPFGFAAFVASEQAKRNHFWAFGGAISGCASLYPQIPYHIMLACLLYLGLSLLTRIKAIDIPRIRMPLFSAAAYMLSALLMRNTVAYDLMSSLIEGALVVLSALLIHTVWMTLSKKRTLLSEEEAICIAICIALCIAGFLPLKIFLFTPAYLASVLLLLVFGYLSGAGVGAAAGISLGFILSMCGGAPLMMMVCLGACGLLCGLLGKIGRIGCITGALVANMLLTLTINGHTTQILSFADLLLSAAIFMLLPRKPLNRLGELLSNTLGQHKTQREYGREIRQSAIEKLNALAVTFDEMGHVFSDLEYSPFEMEESVRRIAHQACLNCPKLKDCWELHLPETYSCVQSMCVDLMRSGSATLKGELVNNCLQVEHLQRVAQQYLDELLKTNGDQSLRHGGKLFAEQLSGISHVVEDLAKDLSVEICFDENIERSIMESLDAQGIRASHVRVSNEKSAPLRVTITLPYHKKSCACEKAVLRTVQKAAQTPITLARRRCPQKNGAHKCILTYQQAAALTVEAGAAQRALPGNGVCGDSYAYEDIGKHKYLLCISDGMGSGPLAASESQATVSLLLNFYKTGYRRETILKSINELMLLHHQSQEMFSTVDLCHLDLLKAEAEIVKIGAAPSMILRGGSVFSFASKSLPIGILEHITPDVYTQPLQNDDYLLLFSDGIYDAFEDEPALKHAVREARTQAHTPQEIADNILKTACDAALQRQTDDDMTVLVAHVKKN